MEFFLSGIAVLVLGYLFYSKLVEKLFGLEPSRPTPALHRPDGVDFVPLTRPRNCLIQLLNIAGVGPIFGPILGALYGPVAFIWIALGTVFAGAVHDYLIGMISVRSNGAHLPGLVGHYLGKRFRHVVNGFCLLLLILVGTVFVTAPAALIFDLTGGALPLMAITLAIFTYYTFATILPVHRLIAPLYPWFGGLLLVASLLVAIALFFSDCPLPVLGFQSFRAPHPQGFAVFPLLFLTISCGALSGFHATQTPIIARTLQSERHARPVFYGMMIAEGIIAMIWCAAAIALKEAGLLEGLLMGENAVGPAGVVREISTVLLSPGFGLIIVAGIIILPITSGDTAFRSARMILADYLGLGQRSLHRRLIIALPLFAVAVVLTQLDFTMLWQYFSWANQTLAAIALWTCSAYLVRQGIAPWVSLLPAVLITAAANTYILYAGIGFGLPLPAARLLGLLSALALAAALLLRVKRKEPPRATIPAP